MGQQQEIVKIHTDQSLYFSGDTIWNSCYVLNDGNITTDNSIKLVQYVLVSIDKKMIMKGKIPINNGKGSCNIPISKELKSGIYTLYAFLPFEAIGKKVAYCIPIVIYNLDDYKSSSLPIDTLINQQRNSKTYGKVLAQLSKTDDLQWKLKLSNEAGDAVPASFSMSIIDSSLVPTIVTRDTVAEVDAFTAYHKKGKGLQLVGEVNFKGNVPAELNAIILRDSMDPTFLQHQILGNKYPKFTFSNFNLEGNRTLFLELKKNYGNPFEFTIQKDSFNFSFVYTTMPPVEIKRLALLKKLKKIFYTQNQKSIAVPAAVQPLILTNEPIRIIYDLTKYMEFKTMRETIAEIIGIIKIRTKKEVTSITVSDGERKLFFTDEPLFLIDGIPSFSNKVLFDLEPSEVKNIEVLHPRSLVPAWRAIGTHGIIDVRTKAGDFQMNASTNTKKINFQGYSNTLPNRPSTTPTPANYPDFRTTLFWNSALETDKNGAFGFTFVPNHNSSNYYMVIKGITQEGKYFELQQKIKDR